MRIEEDPGKLPESGAFSTSTQHCQRNGRVAAPAPARLRRKRSLTVTAESADPS